MKNKSKVLIVLAGLLALLLLAGCNSDVGSQDEETDQLQLSTLPIVENQPLPNLGGYSWEREMVIKLTVLRNKGYATWTYTWQYGQLVEVCPSLGYPIPYAVQLTAPEVGVGTYYTLPQPEANTLYMPSSAEASWVLCVDEKGNTNPTYLESRAEAYTFRLKADRILERYDGAEGQSSINLEDIKISKDGTVSAKGAEQHSNDLGSEPTLEGIGPPPVD